MRQMKRIGVLILIAAASLHASVMQQKPDPQGVPPQSTVKVGVDLVNVLFSVSDRKGHFVPGLTYRDFTVEEDGKKQNIRYFSREADQALTLGLLIDVSPSVKSVFDEERIAAVRFLDSVLRPKDLAMVIGFEKTVTLYGDLTEDKRLLEDSIRDLRLGPVMDGGTSMFDALYLASKEKLREEVGRKAIILITDGQDTTSKVQANEAMVAIHESDSVIYSIAIAPEWRTTFTRLGLGSGPNTSALRRLSEETGGRMFYVHESSEFEPVFTRINEELRNQYSLAYVSTNTDKDGKFRKIRIVPRDSNYRINARKGYFAAKAPTQ